MHPRSQSPILAIVLALALFGTPTLSTATININVDAVRKSVVFLYATDDKGNVDSAKPLGTGFIVEVPLASNPGRSYKLLVTARHVIDPQWARCPAPNPTKIYMRVNTKDFNPEKEDVGTEDLPIMVSPETWRTADDQEVDAAVTVLDGSKLDAYDVGGVHIAEFPTPEELKTFTAGDAIVSAGLFPGASGKKRNYPIFKFGNISSVPNETADAACGSQSRSLKLWFVAASLVPGNSGSPIFYVPAGFAGLTVGASNNRAVLLGVQSMSFLPWDVAGMTPIEHVYKIVEGMKLPDADLRRGPPITPASEGHK
jgi:hypothetical protein